MGRSPVLATRTRMVSRPALITISPSAHSSSPGITGELTGVVMGASRDRAMNGDELRAVGERGLDLHLGDHLGHAVHDVRPREDGRAESHELRDTAAIARALED